MATGKLGEKITCGCCLETIIRTGPNQLFCTHDCAPHDDALIKCTVCGKEKHPREYYSHRYNIDGKLVRRCKGCVSNAKRAYYNKLKQPVKGNNERFKRKIRG